jgi:hypothetical protein
MTSGPEQNILRVYDPSKRSVLLDDDREAFCRAIVARNGIEKAYKMAYNVKADRESALLLLQNPEVMQRINKLERERIVMRNLTKESLIVGLKEIYDVSIADYFDEELERLKPTDEWTEPMRAAAKKVKHSKFGIEFEIADKTVVVDKIISMLGYSEEAKKEGSDSELAKYTDKELEDMATMDVDYEEVKQVKGEIE